MNQIPNIEETNSREVEEAVDDYLAVTKAHPGIDKRKQLIGVFHQQLQKALYDERHSLLTTVKAMSWDANNETPDAIRILKELYDLLSTADHSELDQDIEALTPKE